MKSNHLNEFIKYSEKGMAFLPLGTIEWHGEHLPIEADFMIAQRICELLSKKFGGYLLPPIYLGTDQIEKIKGKSLRGMDRRLGKKLQGSLYYLKPKLFYELVASLVQNLIDQGYKKIVIVTGHGGSKQMEVLERIKKDYKNVILLNPYTNLEKEYAGHANTGELSLFCALYPKEREKILKRKIPKDNDCFKYIGHDPRKKASLSLGKKILKRAMKRLSSLEI